MRLLTEVEIKYLEIEHYGLIMINSGIHIKRYKCAIDEYTAESEYLGYQSDMNILVRVSIVFQKCIIQRENHL